MLKQDLDADQNQDYAARDLRLGLPPRAEHIADLYAHGGTYKGGCTNEQHSGNNTA